jgi:hyperosmotically inducible protein
MKAFQAIKMVGGALIVLASVSAYAQTSDAAATAAPTAASAAPNVHWDAKCAARCRRPRA